MARVRAQSTQRWGLAWYLAQGLVGAAYQRFLEIAIYSSVWVAGALASLAIFSVHVLGLDLSWRPVALVFTSALIVYNLDHVADARVQEIPEARAQRYFRHPAVLLLLVASAVATGLLVGFAPRPAQWIFGLYMSVGLIYGLPIVPQVRQGRWTVARLKDLPWIKSWLVAGVITLATVYLPIAWAGGPAGSAASELALFVFVFAASNVHMFDVRDLESDRGAGVLTLPVGVGVRQTKQALALLNLIVLAAMMWGWAGRLTGPHPEILVSGVVTVLYVMAVDVRTPRAVYAIIVDGCWYLPALLVNLHDVAA